MSTKQSGKTDDRVKPLRWTRVRELDDVGYVHTAEVLDGRFKIRTGHAILPTHMVFIPDESGVHPYRPDYGTVEELKYMANCFWQAKLKEYLA